MELVKVKVKAKAKVKVKRSTLNSPNLPGRVTGSQSLHPVYLRGSSQGPLYVIFSFTSWLDLKNSLSS